VAGEIGGKGGYPRRDLFETDLTTLGGALEYAHHRIESGPSPTWVGRPTSLILQRMGIVVTAVIVPFLTEDEPSTPTTG
jgi:hypothetical protein